MRTEAYRNAIEQIRKSADNVASQLDGTHTKLMLVDTLGVMLAASTFSRCLSEEELRKGEREHLARLWKQAHKMNTRRKKILSQLDKLALEYTKLSASLTSPSL